ncbi:MAG: single-stranded DNA-binding protein [Bacteroidota bacterium]|nr:single-stranded DNA-binding protein [Bacteroidota bacterium]
MAGINKVILIGNLGADPEVRRFAEDTAVANFNIATTENYKDKSGEWQEKTEWHRIVVWRFLAERAEKYLKKGMKVYIEGKLQTRSWDDKDGNKKYTTEVVAQNFQMLDKIEKKSDSSYGSPPPPSPENAPEQDGADDLPF